MNIIVNSRNWNDKDNILSDWKSLSLSIQPSPFLDIIWIENWLKSLSNPPQIIEAKIKDKCVGLGFLFRGKKQYFKGLITIEQLWLHRTGNPSLDQIWIEHNDFLLDKQYEESVRNAILDHIKSQTLPWHELYIGLSPQSTINKIGAKLGSYRTVVTSPDYSVDLSTLSSRECYLASLSKNTRSQIKRSLKLLNQQGELTLVCAKNLEQKQSFFTQMAQMHQQKWRNTESGSGFDNPSFVAFHKEVIFKDVKNIYTHLFCLSINRESFAYIYILKSADTWNFYLSGVKTHAQNKIKIGLVAHTLVIEQAILAGVKKYAFLAGEARYKHSMSNVVEPEQALVCFYKYPTMLKLQLTLRWLKQKLSFNSH